MQQKLLEEIQMAKRRIEYIDFIKGFLILWVVWFHTSHPDILSIKVRMPAFIFLSGIFFKKGNYTDFISKKINQLFIPFLFFYAISYLTQLSIHYIAPSTRLSTFNFYVFKDLFILGELNEPFKSTNTALWFLFGIFFIQLIYQRMTVWVQGKKKLLMISFLITFIGCYMSENIPTPLAFGHSASFFIYYALGVLYGKDMAAYLSEHKIKGYYFLLGIVMIFVMEKIKSDFWVNQMFMTFFQSVIFIPFLFYFSPKIYRLPVIKNISFFGRNSLIVLSVHILLLSITSIAIYKLINVSIDSPIWGLIQTLLVSILLIPVIKILNRNFSVFIGKSNIDIKKIAIKNNVLIRIKSLYQ